MSKNNDQALLKFLETIRVPSTTAIFNPKEHFVVGSGPHAPVNIVGVDESFTEVFFSGNHLCEQSSEHLLYCYELLQPIIGDAGIIHALNDSEAWLTLVDVFALMKMQGKGEEGSLVVGLYSNIFYIPAANKLYAVCVMWETERDGWVIWADLVGVRYRRERAARVFSCRQNVPMAA